MDFSIQSRKVKTEMIEKMPIVIPKSERNVLNLLTITELKAKANPSLSNLKNIIQNNLSVLLWKSSKIINSTSNVIVLIILLNN
jgi:hypothetical protein